MEIDTNRNEVQDGVRGVLVLLACLEHFGSILNSWYIDYFSPSNLFGMWRDPKEVLLYSIHSEWVGHALPVDGLTRICCQVLVPWVTPLFIALSGFNLSRSSPERLRSEYRKRLGTYLFLFFLFFVENLIVSSDFGIGLSLFPISVWFLILAMLLTVQRYTGLLGVGLCFVVSAGINSALTLRGVDLRPLGAVLEKIHPWAQNSAEPLHYLPFAALGFLLGVQFRRQRYSEWIWGSNSVFWLIVLWTGVAGWMSKDLFQIDPERLFAMDELLLSSFWGQIFLYGAILLALGGIQQFRKVEAGGLTRLWVWVGKHSLAIFFIHRILFVKVLAPLRLHVGSYFGLPMTNTAYELVGFLGLVLLLYRVLEKRGFFGRMFH